MARTKSLEQKKLADVVKAAVEKKGEDIIVLNLSEKTSYTDYFVIISGQSDRQVSAIAESIITTLKENHNLKPISVEGYEVGVWVLIDFGDIVVHVFQPHVRAYYDIEGFWADAERLETENLIQKRRRRVSAKA